MPAEFERLVAEAALQPFSGWDFSYLDGRYVEGKLSWDFAGEVRRLLEDADAMLDLGTGGGEFLSSLAPLPPTCVATEGYQPNLEAARERLAPFGVGVVETFCDDNGIEPQRGALPFKGSAFDLVMDRHEAFVASEVARVLRKGGIFATQQVGDDNKPELRRLFGQGPRDEGRRRRPWQLDMAVQEVESARLKVLKKREERVVSRFFDVGALVYFLKAIPWEVQGFAVNRYAKELRAVHDTIRRTGSFPVTTSRFYVQARKE